MRRRVQSKQGVGLEHEGQVLVGEPVAEVDSSILRGLHHVVEEVARPVEGAEE